MDLLLINRGLATTARTKVCGQCCISNYF